MTDESIIDLEEDDIIAPATGDRPTAEDLEAVIDRYTENLMRAALSLGFSDLDAEEMVHDTFCAYLEGGSRFKKKSQLLTYLFGILYNKAREARRFQKRHESMDAAIDKTFDDHFDSLPAWEPTNHWNMDAIHYFTEVEKHAQSSVLGQMFEQCLEGLGAAMRMAFTLKEVEGMEPDQICAALSVSRTNLGVLLFRARNKLRECLIGKGAVIL